MFITETKNFDASEIEDAVVAAGVLSRCKDVKGYEYYNEPLAFDIETTSFYVQSNGHKEKRAIMYIWKLSIRGIIVRGRTWEEWIEVCVFLSEWYQLSDKRILCIYIHNLGYEFQFMHKYFKWIDVFALKKRQPVRALSTLGIEFRCSLKLSGYSLEKLGTQLITYKVEKLVGNLDYSLMRNSKTKLTEKEEQYCTNDVLVVTAYIQEYIDRVKYIHLIPKTKTGEVRDYTRSQCFTLGVRKEII